MVVVDSDTLGLFALIILTVGFFIYYLLKGKVIKALKALGIGMMFLIYPLLVGFFFIAIFYICYYVFGSFLSVDAVTIIFLIVLAVLFFIGVKDNLD